VCVFSGVHIDAYVNVDSNCESDLTYAVEQQPVSVNIDASDITFQLYAFGTYDKYFW
jgi:hypothetical protein